MKHLISSGTVRVIGIPRTRTACGRPAEPGNWVAQLDLVNCGACRRTVTFKLLTAGQGA